MNQIAEELKADAQYEWRKILQVAAAEIERLEAELEASHNLVVTERQYKADGWKREACWEDEVKRRKLQVMELEIALQTIATPKRPDGTYNLCREACEQLAKEALTCLQRTSK